MPNRMLSIVVEDPVGELRDQVIDEFLKMANARLADDAGHGRAPTWPDDDGTILHIVGLSCEALGWRGDKYRLLVHVVTWAQVHEVRADGVWVLHPLGQRTQIDLVGFWYGRDVFLAAFLKMLNDTGLAWQPEPPPDPEWQPDARWFEDWLDEDEKYEVWSGNNDIGTTPATQVKNWRRAADVHILWLADQTQEEIAETLGVSVKTVGSLHRWHKKVRKRRRSQRPGSR